MKLYDSMEAAVTGCFGEGTVITAADHVGGGDINQARCLHLSTGQDVFVKSNTAANLPFFTAEEAGLRAIASTHTVRTPELFCMGTDRGKGVSFLMMDMVRGGKRAPDFWEAFGRELAEMHRVDTAGLVPRGRFGFGQDNFIGASKQRNDPGETWIGFFRTCRLEPQFKMASGYFGRDEIRMIRRLVDRLEDLLIEPAEPSLLHGDLWSGNYIVGTDGKAWLIDPAVYVGHREADLAMTELFGGFSGAFYGAYQEAFPLEAGYEERRDLYNLYHLLNHLNLFGPGYLSAVMRTVRHYQ